MPSRALILIRLSRVTDATTSPERQREACERFISERGWTVAGIAEDLDTSGSVDPLKRPGAGPWLRDRLSEFDVIVSWKLDRVGRNARDMSSLVNFLLDHGKSLATVQDSIDIGTPVGRMLVYILATLAEMELASISDRNTASSQYLIQNGRWRGGVLPAGYRAVANPDGAGLVLVPDHDGMAPTIRGIVADVLAGKRLAGIVKALNDQGVQTSKDRSDVLAGREPKARRWTISNVNRMLSSPTLLGRIVSNGQVLYGDDGRPVQRAEPLISESDYHRLQAVLAERAESAPKQKKAAAPTLLLHVLRCGRCGEPMYRLKGSPGRKPRYRCASVQNGGSCGSLSPTQEEADRLVVANLFRYFGNVEFVERRRVAGNDPSAELAEVDAQLASLGEAVTRFPAGSPALGGLLAQVDALSARREELAAMPVVADGWEHVPTGETFAQRFAAMDLAEMNDFLRAHDVRAEYVRLPGEAAEWSLTFGDVPGLLSAVDPGAVNAFPGAESDQHTFSRLVESLRQ